MKETITLFCLPFAGGNKYSYREYIQQAPSFLQLFPLEYPGRGTRIKEPLVSDIGVLVNDLYKTVTSKIKHQNYALYGHSMGGLVAYLLALELVRNNHIPPVHLFITGTTGPSAPSRSERKRYLLEKEEFIEEIRKLDGMPEEILENEELLYYFEPILRSDFKISEEYIHQNHPPLNIPITVITGTEEDMETEDIKLWQEVTARKVDFRQMPGKHFFIFNHSREIMNTIAHQLSIYTKAYHI